MAITKQNIHSNESPYPKSWYQASGNWSAKTVTVAADRYKLTSPTAMQIDVGNLSLTNTVAQEIDLSVSTNWGANVTTRANSTAYVVGDVIPTPITSTHYWECTTAGVSASSDPGSWGIAVGNTKADGSTLVWTARYVNPASANELMILDVAPGGSGWSVGNTLTGATSGAVSTVVTVLSTTAYIVSGRTRSYKLGEIISNGTDTADQGAAYPVLSGRAGQDFYIYACVGTSTVPVIKVSPNSTYPWGYNATTSRKIGGFHCLCASAGTISTHSASGYATGDIIPNSVWDLKNRSASGSNVGLAYIDKRQDWHGIYPLSGTSGAPTNVYGGTHLVSVDWNTCVDAAKTINMKLPGDADFQVAASGSNEETNILGSADSVTVGGHVDTAGRRMISNYFLEDCCGLIYQWLDEQSYQFTGATAHTHKVTVSGDAETVVSDALSGTIATITLNAGGTGYAANDTFTINGGVTLARGTVTTVSGGVVTAISLNTSYLGTGYSVANAIDTTNIVGSGTGLKVNITGLSTNDVAPAWAYYDLPGAKGSLYKQGTYGDVKLLAGGSWDSGTRCGSRYRALVYYRWNAVSDIGVRAVARSVER